MTGEQTLSSRVLHGEGDPLVAITIVGRHEVFVPGLQTSYNRSMGFITQRLRGNLRLITTCRHAFQNFGSQRECVLSFNNPTPTELKMVGGPILDTNPESDIAFVIARDPKNVRTHALEIRPDDLPLTGTTWLYNAQNKTNFSTGLCDIFVARQPVMELPMWYFIKLEGTLTHCVPWDNEEDCAQWAQDGWIRCRTFNMVSRHGFSGSPIFDEDMRLYGIDVRGTDPSMMDYVEKGDRTICVPTSEVFKARERVDPQIQKVLRSL